MSVKQSAFCFLLSFFLLYRQYLVRDDKVERYFNERKEKENEQENKKKEKKKNKKDEIRTNNHDGKVKSLFNGLPIDLVR